MGEVEQKQKKREKEPKDNGTSTLLERESSENVNPNLLYHHTIVSISGTASAEGVSARRKVLENRK